MLPGDPELRGGGKKFHIRRKLLLGQLYREIALPAKFHARNHRGQFLNLQRAKAPLRKISSLGEYIRLAAPKNIIYMSRETSDCSVAPTKNEKPTRAKRRYPKLHFSYGRGSSDLKKIFCGDRRNATDASPNAGYSSEIRWGFG